MTAATISMMAGSQWRGMMAFVNQARIVGTVSGVEDERAIGMDEPIGY